MNNKPPLWEDFISFCQALIQTPSLSGDEGRVARVIKEKMEELPYDDVWIDQVGNVIGLVKGAKDKPAICFTAHMDHVPPGEESDWEYPPYSGVIANGYIHGRGASDLKGPAATQVYIPALLKNSKVEHGDIYIIQVVHEETGGLGSMCLDKEIKEKIDYAINGEPTSNMIHIGHRGRLEIVVIFKGKSFHASIAGQYVNPLYNLAKFLMQLQDLEMAKNNEESSTAVPTICYSSPQTSNVTPNECRLTIDWRNIPGETETQIINRLQKLLPRDAEISIAEYTLKTYTGLNFKMKRCRLPFAIDRNHPFVQTVVKAVESTLNRKVMISRWSCATDCGYFMDEGIPIVGFSPAEAKYMHTTKDRISLKLMEEAMRCYPTIIAFVSRLPKRARKGQN